MSSLIKRVMMAGLIGISCTLLPGCVNSSDYHDGNGGAWVQEQVEKGNLTLEEAQEILQQEK